MHKMRVFACFHHAVGRDDHVHVERGHAEDTQEAEHSQEACFLCVCVCMFVCKCVCSEGEEGWINI